MLEKHDHMPLPQVPSNLREQRHGLGAQASYDSLADLLTFAHMEGLQGLRGEVSTPGWFSAFVHSCMSGWQTGMMGCW